MMCLFSVTSFLLEVGEKERAEKEIEGLKVLSDLEAMFLFSKI